MPTLRSAAFPPSSPLRESNRAARLDAFGGPEHITVDDLPLGTLPEGHVRVRVEAASVSATDTIIRRNMYPPLAAKAPLTLGYDFVGLIVDGTPDRIGQRVAGVCVTGGNASFVDVPKERAAPVTDELSATLLAALPLFGITAYQMLHRVACVATGDRVLVHGATGAVGTMLTSFARHAGCEVVGTGSPEKAQAIHGDVVDYRGAEYLGTLRKRGGRAGYQAVFDALGPQSFRQSYKLLAEGGTLVTYGLGKLATRVPQRTAIGFGRLALGFVSMSTGNAWRNALPGKRRAEFYDIAQRREADPSLYAADLQALCELVGDLESAPPVNTYAGLEAVRELHEAIDSGTASGINVVRIADA